MPSRLPALRGVANWGTNRLSDRLSDGQPDVQADDQPNSHPDGQPDGQPGNAVSQRSADPGPNTRTDSCARHLRTDGRANEISDRRPNRLPDPGPNR